MRNLFLETARVVTSVLARPEVAAAWKEPSSLEEQTVGQLAAHLGRAVTTVVRGLDDPPPSEATVADAVAYVSFAAKLGPHDHAGVRSRSAEAAAAGAAVNAEVVAAAVGDLERRLVAEPPDRLVVVFGGNGMDLDAYLETRILEMVVHLHDLRRSLGVDLAAAPIAAVEHVLVLGLRVGLAQAGPDAVVEAFFRADTTALPVL